jgi:hypothetical protein
MIHAQKPIFVFRPNGRVHLNRWCGGGWGSVQLTTGRRAVHIRLQGLYCSCKPAFCSHVTLAYWLPNPFSCFSFASLVGHRAPSHFKSNILCVQVDARNESQSFNTNADLKHHMAAVIRAESFRTTIHSRIDYKRSSLHW